MSRPTPCATAAVPVAAPGPALLSPDAERPPHPAAAIAPRARERRPPRRSAWTLLLVPPARAPGAVRSIFWRRWQTRLLLGLLAIVLLGTAWAGGYATARWQADALGELAREIVAADAQRLLAGRQVRTLRDSLAVLRTALAARESAPVTARRGTAGAAPVAGRGRAATRPAASALAPAEGVTLPLAGRITSGWSRSRLHPILRIRRPHHGIDISAASGTVITAPAAGRVTRVSRDIGYGLVVHVEHAGGVQTRYAHCRTALVTEGDAVTAGLPIATVGRSGLATAPHLHYEVRVRGASVDPLRHRFLAAAPDSIATP